MSSNEEVEDFGVEEVGHNEPMVYEVEDDDGTIWTIYRISATGRCLLELVASKTGWPAADPPPQIAAAYQRGHETEKAILDAYMKEYGVALRDYQRTVEFVLAPGIKLKGHIDALNVGSGNVVDAKYYRADVADRIAGDPEKYMPQGYLFQGAGYAAALGGVGIEFVFGRRVVTSQGTTGTLDGIHVIEYVWDELKPYLGKTRLKIAKAEKIAREDLEWPLCDDAKIFPCPFHELRIRPGGGIEAKKNAKKPSDIHTFASSDVANLAKSIWEAREDADQKQKYYDGLRREANERLEVLMQQEAGECESTQTWDIEGRKVLRVVKDAEQYDWVAIRRDIKDFDARYKKKGVPKVKFLQRGRGEV